LIILDELFTKILRDEILWNDWLGKCQHVEQRFEYQEVTGVSASEDLLPMYIRQKKPMMNSTVNGIKLEIKVEVRLD
jgi:hypothetical protein